MLSAVDSQALERIRPACLAKITKAVSAHDTDFPTTEARDEFLADFEAAPADVASSVSAYRDAVLFFSSNIARLAGELAATDPVELAHRKHNHVRPRDEEAEDAAQHEWKSRHHELEADAREGPRPVSPNSYEPVGLAQPHNFAQYDPRPEDNADTPAAEKKGAAAVAAKAGEKKAAAKPAEKPAAKAEAKKAEKPAAKK